MPGQRLFEDRKTARVFSFELHAGWAVRITRSKCGHSIGLQRRHHGAGFSAKLLAPIQPGPIAHAVHPQLQGPRPATQPEMPSTKTPHSAATDTRHSDTN